VTYLADNGGMCFQRESRYLLSSVFNFTVIKQKYVLLTPRCCQLHSARLIGNASYQCFLSKLRQSSTHFHLPYNQLIGAECVLKSWHSLGYSSNLLPFINGSVNSSGCVVVWWLWWWW
jgi:hypothetical protein